MSKRHNESAKPVSSPHGGLADAENPSNSGSVPAQPSPHGGLSDNEQAVAELWFLTGQASGFLTQSATSTWMSGFVLAQAKALIRENPDALRRHGITSLDQVAARLGIDRSTAYELAKNADLLGETAYRAAERAGLTRAEYRQVRSLPKGQLEEAQRILEDAGDRPADKVKGAVKALLDAYSDERSRAEQAEQREKRAKTEQQKQKELATARLEELNRIRADKRLDYAAVNDIPLTSLAQETSAYITKALSLADALKRRQYNAEDKRILRRLGGRACQAGEIVVWAFTQAMGGLEGLKKGMVVDPDVANAWIPDGVVEPPPMGDDRAFRDRPKRPRSPEPADPVEQTTDGDTSNL